MKHISEILSSQFSIHQKIDSLICYYKGFLIRPVVKFTKGYNNPYFEYNIFDFENWRCLYQSKFNSIKAVQKFIDLHLSDLNKWKLI